MIFFLLGIMLFVVTGFLAYAYRQYNVGYVCDVLELWKQDSQCEQLLAGTVSFLTKYFPLTSLQKIVLFNSPRFRRVSEVFTILAIYSTFSVVENRNVLPLSQISVQIS